MTRMQWGALGEKRTESGVDQGALFLKDGNGDFTQGFPWNGLVSVTESPSGAESNKQYADNQVYANLKSAEQFGATIECFTFPKAFERADGVASPVAGMSLTQQNRETFCFSYRTKIGNDQAGPDAGYTLHLIYDADAGPSEVSRNTLNEDPELASFSYEVTTTPRTVGTLGATTYKATSHVKVDSTLTTSAKMQAIEDILYGSAGSSPRFPTPLEVYTILGTGLTDADLATLANQPSFVAGTGIVTLPAVTGVQWKQDGVNKAAGALPAIASGATTTITAVPTTGYRIVGDTDWTYKRP